MRDRTLARVAPNKHDASGNGAGDDEKKQAVRPRATGSRGARPHWVAFGRSSRLRRRVVVATRRLVAHARGVTRLRRMTGAAPSSRPDAPKSRTDVSAAPELVTICVRPTWAQRWRPIR